MQALTVLARSMAVHPSV